MKSSRGGGFKSALVVAALALSLCFVAAKSERAAAEAMDAVALKSCLGSVHSRDPEEKLLALGSAWNSMTPSARLGFLKEIRRAEHAEDVDDFTLLQISAVESPEFSKAPVGCFSTALEVTPPSTSSYLEKKCLRATSQSFYRLTVALASALIVFICLRIPLELAGAPRTCLGLLQHGRAENDSPRARRRVQQCQQSGYLCKNAAAVCEAVVNLQTYRKSPQQN